MANVDRHIARRPPHARYDGRWANPIAEWRGEPAYDAFVAVVEAPDSTFANVVARTPALGQCSFADERRFGGVKAFDVLQCEATIVRETAAAGFRPQEVSERTIGCALLVEATHDALESFPEIIRGSKPIANDLPATSADVHRGECSSSNDFLELRRTAVDEFRAELDWHRRSCVPTREHSPADSVAGFEDDDIDLMLAERSGGGESGGAGSDDDDIDRG
jgi:hypothetical protein